MPVVTVEKPLKDKLGDDGVESLIHLLNATNREHKEDVLQFVEEKFERRLTEEISAVNERITNEISKVNERITEENAKTRSELVKWMFIFWVGQIGVIMGLLFAFFR